jgi:hypothetical protein
MRGRRHAVGDQRTLRTRMQPWDGRLGISCGWLVPWIPTTPPPGQSGSASTRWSRTPTGRSGSGEVADPLSYVVVVGWRGGAGRAVPDRGLPDPAPRPAQHGARATAVGLQRGRDRAQRAERGSRNRSGPAVRPSGNPDLDPRPSVGHAAAQRQVDLGIAVLGEHAQAVGAGTAASRAPPDRCPPAHVRPTRERSLVGEALVAERPARVRRPQRLGRAAGAATTRQTGAAATSRRIRATPCTSARVRAAARRSAPCPSA